MPADPKKLGVMVSIGKDKSSPPKPPFGGSDAAPSGQGGDPASQQASPAAFDPTTGEPCPTCGWGHMPPGGQDPNEPDADDLGGAQMQNEGGAGYRQYGQ